MNNKKKNKKMQKKYNYFSKLLEKYVPYYHNIKY